MIPYGYSPKRRLPRQTRLGQTQYQALRTTNQTLSLAQYKRRPQDGDLQRTRSFRYQLSLRYSLDQLLNQTHFVNAVLRSKVFGVDFGASSFMSFAIETTTSKPGFSELSV